MSKKTRKKSSNSLASRDREGRPWRLDSSAKTPAAKARKAP